MTTLICTTSSLEKPSASLNRVKRMRDAMLCNGESAVIVGTNTKVAKSKPFSIDVSNGYVAYNPLLHPGFHITAGYRLAKQSANFYRTQLELIIKEIGADAVIAYTSYDIVASSICQCAHQSSMPFVLDMVEWQASSIQNLINGLTLQQVRLRKRTIPISDGIIGISKAWCEWADTTGIPNVWIPSFADDSSRPQTDPAKENPVFTIVFIGHWVRRECPAKLLQALAICIDRGVPVRLKVLGNVGKHYRERAAMRELQRHPKLIPHVEFTGYVSDAERDTYLVNADAFILLRPVSRETDMLFPTRLPEYLVAGNPVILSETGNFPHLFEHRKDVWFVDPNNKPQEIADAIIHLAKNPDERRTIGANGRETALSKLGLPVLGKRLADFLHSVHDKRNHKNK